MKIMNKLIENFSLYFDMVSNVCLQNVGVGQGHGTDPVPSDCHQ